MAESNSCKIVDQALSFVRPDRLPVYESYWPEFDEQWRRLRRIGPDVKIEDHFGLDLMVCVANETLFPTRMRQIKKSGAHVFLDDGWGRIIRTAPGTYFSETVERIFTRPADLDQMEFDSPHGEDRYKSFNENVTAQKAKGRAVFVKIGGVFIRSSFFRGETEFLMDLAADESFAQRIAEKVADHLLQIGLESLRRADAYGTGIWIYDDMCNAQAPMFSPGTFERVFLPIYRRMIAALKAAGAKSVILHSDGNLLPLLDMIIDAGFTAINPVERNAGLIVENLMNKYYGKLAFIGGVCNTQILPSGDAVAIRKHVETICQAGQNGGLIIGTHSIGPDISVENYELYRRIVAQQGNFRQNRLRGTMADCDPCFR